MQIGSLIPFYASFGEVVDEQGESFSVQDYDGILGLGFKELANIPNNPIFPMMVSSFVVPDATFSLWIEKKIAPGRPSGVLTLGGISQRLFTGPLIWMPVMRQSYWVVRLDKGTMFGFDILVSGENRAVIDSGTSFIILPTSTAEGIFRLLGAKPLDEGSSAYHVDCNAPSKLAPLRFTLYQTGFELMPRDYIMKIQGKCILTFLAEDIESSDGYLSWVLGSVFLRKYFTAYDMKKNAIGFATSVSSETLMQDG
jgi:saccharopepsin